MRSKIRVRKDPDIIIIVYILLLCSGEFFLFFFLPALGARLANIGLVNGIWYELNM